MAPRRDVKVENLTFKLFNINFTFWWGIFFSQGRQNKPIEWTLTVDRIEHFGNRMLFFRFVDNE